MRQSLRGKIRALILVPILALGAIAAVAFSFLTNREVDHRIRADVSQVTELLRNFIRERRHHLELQTQLLADMPYLKSAALTKDRATAQIPVDRYAPDLDADGMLLTNPDGQAWIGSGTFDRYLRTKTAQLGVDQALEGRSWSGVIRTPRGLVLAATAPFMNAGYAKGTVTCYSLIDSRLARALAKGIAAEVAFVQGGRITSSSLQNLPVLSNVSATKPTQIDLNGSSYAGMYAPFPGSGSTAIGFVALRDVNQMTGSAHLLLTAFLCILAVASLASAMIANRFAGNVIHPLEDVVAAAASMSLGKWPDKFKVIRKDEIGILQKAFNDLADSLKESQRRLLAMVDLDPLTELQNHRRFKEHLGLEAAKCLNEQGSLSLILFDLDRFATFNKAKGLSSGDEILRLVAQLLRRTTPEGAQLSRYGGEEFAVLLPNWGLAEASALAETIREKFGRTIGWDGLKLTMSAGCAEVGVGTDKPESIALAAELALTKAKQLGRNRVCEWDAQTAGNGSTDPFQLHKFLQDGTLATIQALAAAVDAKDPYTQGHSQRVAQYAADLCQTIGGSPDEIELVYRTGTLHDVGKIGVPDLILKKAGPMSADERATMETHPVLGEIIVRKVPQLQDTLPGVRHHHERYDGKGYPDGLAGEAIPRIARILAVADTYDAMNSDRPYRAGLGATAALDEIERGAGSQFDPEFARAFVNLMRGRRSLRKAA